MSKLNASIMYVGDVDCGRQLLKAAKTRGWHVYLPGEAMEALSVHIFYYPDVVVLDRSAYPIMAAEVGHHLRSLNDGTPILEIAGLDLPVLLGQIETTLEDFTTTTHDR